MYNTLSQIINLREGVTNSVRKSHDGITLAQLRKEISAFYLTRRFFKIKIMEWEVL
jgi:hypothetical protein